MTGAMSTVRPRRMTQTARERLAEAPVLLLEGPRSVGKSTVVRAIAEEHGAEVVDLDQPAVLDAVARDTERYVSDARLVCIDEYQLAPQVLQFIKAKLNQGARPGMFVLAGSVSFAGLPTGVQALTGRVQRVQLLPFSQGELAGVEERWLEQLLTSGEVPRDESKGIDRADYVQRIVTGGFPLAVAATSERARIHWIDSYIDMALTRDITQVATVRKPIGLSNLLTVMGSQTAELLNVDRAARSAGISRVTAERHLALLESVFLLRRLPAWNSVVTHRATRNSKVHVLDSAVASRILKLSAARLNSKAPDAATAFGHLLESFVVGELIKQGSWISEPIRFFHWRTHEGFEIDLIAERSDGGIVAFEVKAGPLVSDKDFKPMQVLRDKVGDRFLAGVVLNTGTEAYRTPAGFHVSPISHIWA